MKTPIDVARAGETLRHLRALWPQENITVYVGLDSDTGRVHVGWIRDESRRAFRLSGATMAIALETAQTWTRMNPTRAGR